MFCLVELINLSSGKKIFSNKIEKNWFDLKTLKAENFAVKFFILEFFCSVDRGDWNLIYNEIDIFLVNSGFSFFKLILLKNILFFTFFNFFTLFKNAAPSALDEFSSSWF
jgi:hypothetical protein